MCGATRPHFQSERHSVSIFMPPQAQRAFAPGMQFHQRFVQSLLIQGYITQHRSGAAQCRGMLGRRQRRQCSAPFRQVTMWMMPQPDFRQIT